MAGRFNAFQKVLTVLSVLRGFHGGLEVVSGGFRMPSKEFQGCFMGFSDVSGRL